MVLAFDGLCDEGGQLMLLPLVHDHLRHQQASHHANIRTSGGRYPSNSSKCAAERSVANWVRTQRKARRGIGTKMTAERAAQLEQVPEWRWSQGSGQYDRLTCRLVFARKVCTQPKTVNPPCDPL